MSRHHYHHHVYYHKAYFIPIHIEMDVREQHAQINKKKED